MGVVDLVTMKAYYFEGDNGENLREEEIPAELQDQADEYREKLLDEVSMLSDELAEDYMEETVTEDLLNQAIREATLAHQITPVLMGSAYKNKGVQKLLDAVIAWLPCPTVVVNEAIDMTQSTDTEEVKVEVPSDPNGNLVALAFKLMVFIVS